MVTYAQRLHERIDRLHGDFDGSPNDFRVVTVDHELVLRTLFNFDAASVPQAIVSVLHGGPDDKIRMQAISHLKQTANNKLACLDPGEGLTSMVSFRAIPPDLIDVGKQLWYGSYALDIKTPGGKSVRDEVFVSELIPPGDDQLLTFYCGDSARQVEELEARTVLRWLSMVVPYAPEQSQAA